MSIRKNCYLVIVSDTEQDELKEGDEEAKETHEGPKNVCQECGRSFKKPAYLRQHMQSHGLEVIYIACNLVFCILSFWAQLFFIHEIVC